jgi:hypothetical protein
MSFLLSHCRGLARLSDRLISFVLSRKSVNDDCLPLLFLSVSANPLGLLSFNASSMLNQNQSLVLVAHPCVPAT